MITTADIRQLRQQLEEAGVFEHRSRATAIKFGTMVLATALGAVAFALLPWWCAFVVLPLTAVPAVTAAMVGHEGCHGAFAGSSTTNAIMSHIAFPAFTGLGIIHWKHKHNVRHHGHPNVYKLDDDIELWPFATSRAEYLECGRFRRWFQRNLQGYLFWPMTMLLSYVMRLETIKSSIRYGRRHGVNSVLAADVACQAVHYLLWLVVPMILFGFWPVVWFYVGVWSVAGLLMALIFTPAHIGLPIVEHQEKGWEHQLDTTRNLRLPRFISWFFVGLDYQVEHHLFPRIPHQNMLAASRIVRPWCDRLGVAYNTEPYHCALVSTAKYFKSGWSIDLAESTKATVPETGAETSTDVDRCRVTPDETLPTGHSPCTVSRLTARVAGNDVA